MNIERPDLVARAARHAALADVARLAVVDALELGDRSPSELQSMLRVPSNLLAHHLKVLEEAGLVARRRSEGDRRRTYLTLLDASVPGREVEQVPVRRVMFVCSANSARSQLAAALWARTSDVPVVSAGTRPAERIAEGARSVARRRALTLISSTPHDVADTSRTDDFVVAVCDHAYEELGDAVSVHWSIPDPVADGGEAAFDDAYAELDRRIATLAHRLIAS